MREFGGMSPWPATSLANVRVWSLDVGALVQSAARDRALALLPRHERERAQRIADHRAHEAYLARRILARIAVGHELDAPPSEIGFCVDDSGRPEIIAPDHSPRVRFSLSGCDSLVVCAVTRTQAVGVDVERLREPPLEVVDELFSSPEREAFWTTPAENRRQMFFSIWTLKEAFVKARGGGIAAFDTFGVGHQPPALLPYGAFGAECHCWHFACLSPDPDHHLAICVRRSETDERAAMVLVSPREPA